MILAADIGGTNTRLAIFDGRQRRLVMRHREEFKNAGRSGLVEIVQSYLARHPGRVEIACFGVAGPVQDRCAELTNLKWTLCEKDLQRQLKIPRVALINDLVAHAEGINELRPKDLVTLYKGKPLPGGARAIIAPGTGLGEGGLIYDAELRDYRAVPSEGGHCDFSPKDDREIALLKYMHAAIGRCTWEDTICGPGLRHIWGFLTSPGKLHVRGSPRRWDPSPADITRAAMDGSCAACVAAVELFVSLLGAEAGNLALKFLATGGVYIGGGIAPHILKFLRRPPLRRAFANKGPRNVQRILAQVPIHVILSETSALLGAAHYARRLGSVRPGR